MDCGKKTSCFGCEAPKRHSGCHSTCDDYKREAELRKQFREENLRLRKENEYFFRKARR